MLSVVIQAGGKSTRMGADKALLSFQGVPLVKRLVDRFNSLGDEILIISNHPDAHRFLELPVYEDLIPDRGSLGGLYTALGVAAYQRVALIAVDMPFASRELIIRLLEILDQSETAAVIPSSNGGLEPLHAVYNRDVCLPLVKNALKKDLWKMNSWHKMAKVKILSHSETKELIKSDHVFLNLNTPEDVKNAEAIAKDTDWV